MSVYTTPKSQFWQYDFQCRGLRYFGALPVRSSRPKREAEKAEKVIRDSIGQPGTRPRITLHAACDRYWNEHGKHLANPSGENGRLKHLQRLLGDIHFDTVDDSLAAYVATRRAEKARNKDTEVLPATINRELECLRRIIRRAKKVWKVQTPEMEIADFLLEEPKERVRSLTADEETDFFASVADLRPDFKDVWEFKLLSLKRLAEVIGLLKRRVDRKNKRATVIQKGGQEIVVTLTPSMMAIIDRNWLNHPTHVFTYVCQKNRTYFKDGKQIVQRKGHRYPFTQNGWRKQMKDILEDAGIVDFRVHDFRHTGATRMLKQTGNLKVVQKALGHSSITATARYAHTDEEQTRTALEAAETMRPPGLKSRNEDKASEDLKDNQAVSLDDAIVPKTSALPG